MSLHLILLLAIFHNNDERIFLLYVFILFIHQLSECVSIKFATKLRIMSSLFKVRQNVYQFFCLQRNCIRSEDRYIEIFWFRLISCWMNVECMLGECLTMLECVAVELHCNNISHLPETLVGIGYNIS